MRHYSAIKQCLEITIRSSSILSTETIATSYISQFCNIFANRKINADAKELREDLHINS